jgi:hypothetical protein
MARATQQQQFHTLIAGCNNAALVKKKSFYSPNRLTRTSPRIPSFNAEPRQATRLRGLTIHRLSIPCISSLGVQNSIPTTTTYLSITFEPQLELLDTTYARHGTFIPRHRIHNQESNRNHKSDPRCRLKIFNPTNASKSSTAPKPSTPSAAPSSPRLSPPYAYSTRTQTQSSLC